MDGIHDLGGKHGFGAIACDAEYRPFHARWQASVFAMQRALAGRAFRNVDQFRHGVERIDPIAYLSHGYYGRWLGGLETLAVEAGITTIAQVTERARALGAPANERIAARPAQPPPPQPAPSSASGARRALLQPPAFQLGAHVRTSRDLVPGHTRLPAYARNKCGQVVSAHGGWVFPDTNAHGRGEQPQHLYTVAFTGDELWGASAETGVVVHIDLFESYLRAEQT